MTFLRSLTSWYVVSFVDVEQLQPEYILPFYFMDFVFYYIYLDQQICWFQESTDKHKRFTAVEAERESFTTVT